MKKRIFTLLLTVAMLFSTMTTAYASGGGGVKPRGVFSATLMIAAYQDGNSSVMPDSSMHFGHACIIVCNYSSYPIVVGRMEVAPGDYVTVGVFDNRNPPHEGVWYNVEAKGINNISSYANNAVAAYDLSERSLSTLNNCINSGDYYSYRDHTCAAFAEKCWNAVVPANYMIFSMNEGYVYDILPLDLVQGIKRLGLPNVSTHNLPSKEKEDFAYQAGTGVIYPYKK